MKNTRRSNKKQGKNTRRKRGGKIDYHNLELEYANNYFYTTTNAKNNRPIGNKKSYSPSHGMFPGDLIVIRYSASQVLGKTGLSNVKLHLVTSVQEESFMYKTLGFEGLQRGMNVVNSLYNNTLGMGVRKFGLDMGACTQDQLHKCYSKKFMFTWGFKGNKSETSYGEEYSGIDRRYYNKIFIVKEHGMKGIIASSKGLFKRHFEESYTNNIYSFIVFLKLLNAAYDAMPNKQILINNPMWQTSVDLLKPENLITMILNNNKGNVTYDGTKIEFGNSITYDGTEIITLDHFKEIFYRDRTPIWYKKDQEVNGPYKLYEMRNFLKNKIINQETEISKDKTNYETIDDLYCKNGIDAFYIAFLDIPEKYKQEQPEKYKQEQHEIKNEGWIYIGQDKKEHGPYESSDMVILYKKNFLNYTDLIYRNRGWKAYHPIHKVFPNDNHFLEPVPPEPKVDHNNEDEHSDDGDVLDELNGE
jgi:hypothetical protein